LVDWQLPAPCLLADDEFMAALFRVVTLNSGSAANDRTLVHATMANTGLNAVIMFFMPPFLINIVAILFP
jgi:hypothetical protein